MKTVMAVCIILLAFTTYKIIIYEILIPRMAFSITTLFADYQGERGLYVACEHGKREM